jgi:hypothetical protein
MKKLFATIIFLSSILPAFSQDEQKGVRFGLTLSPQLSWMTASDKNLDGNGSYIGYEYGLLMDILIPKNYAFATGFLFNGCGGSLSYLEETKFNTYDDSVFAAGTAVDYRLQYIVIPLTLKLRTNQIGYVTYYGQFGFRGGINIRSRADISNLGGTTLDEKVDFGADVGPGDFGLLVGGGFDYEITGNTAIHVGIQYYNGFIDITDNPKVYKTSSSLGALKLELGVFF